MFGSGTKPDSSFSLHFDSESSSVPRVLLFRFRTRESLENSGINLFCLFFRLRQLAMKQFELNNGIDHKNLKVPNHLDMSKIKFEVEDLKKLIKATTDDLEEADKQRREEFKR